jgi:hypothetical protein
MVVVVRQISAVHTLPSYLSDPVSYYPPIYVSTSCTLDRWQVPFPREKWPGPKHNSHVQYITVASLNFCLLLHSKYYTVLWWLFETEIIAIRGQYSKFVHFSYCWKSGQEKRCCHWQVSTISVPIKPNWLVWHQRRRHANVCNALLKVSSIKKSIYSVLIKFQSLG